MTKQDFLTITEYIGSIIKGTPFEGHVFAVGGSVRDFYMGNDIKDIDVVIDLPHGGVDFANWCKDQRYTNTVVIYETYGTAMFKFKKFPGEEIECVMTRGDKSQDPEESDHQGEQQDNSSSNQFTSLIEMDNTGAWSYNQQDEGNNEEECDYCKPVSTSIFLCVSHIN